MNAENQEQQPQNNYATTQQLSSGGSQHPSVVGLKLEVNEILDTLQYQLLCQEWDPTTESYRQLEGVNPFINDRGVKEIMSFVRIYISRLTMLSNLGEEMIKRIVLDFEYDLSDIIFSKYEQYEVDLDYASMIVNMFGSTILCTLYRSLLGFEQEKMVNAVRTVESHSFNQNPGRIQGGGFTGSFFKK